MLELQGLSRRYGDVVALDDLSFTVREGQAMARRSGACRVAAVTGWMR